MPKVCVCFIKVCVGPVCVWLTCVYVCVKVCVWLKCVYVFGQSMCGSGVCGGQV